MKYRRACFLLLEVFIAFAIVALTLLPLLYPHYAIYLEQHKFVNKIELDMAVNNFYASTIEKLQRNEISWAAIEQQQRFPLTEDAWLKEIGKRLPFAGSFYLAIDKKKKNEQYGLYLVSLHLELLPTGLKTNAPKKTSYYSYRIFIGRLLNEPLEAAEEPGK